MHIICVKPGATRQRRKGRPGPVARQRRELTWRGHVNGSCRNEHNECDACALRSKDFARARSARHTAPLRAADNTSASSCARRVSTRSRHDCARVRARSASKPSRGD